MLREVFHVGAAEVAQAAVERDVGKVDALDFHALHDLAGEVHAGGGGGDCAFVFGKDALEAFQVFRLALAAYEAWNGRFAEGVERTLELVVVAVVEEAECAAAARGVVDNFRHDGVVFAEIEFIAYSDFPRGIYQHVPQAQFLVEFAQEEYLDSCAGFFLVAVEACGEHLGVVEHENVVLVEEVEDILEHAVLYLARLAVEHHHAAFVSMRRGILGNLLLRQVKLKLGEFHCTCIFIVLFLKK